jgi:acyl-CoA synthetase (NDP forming)
VLKVLSNSILHKSDIGGVAVGLADDQVALRAHQMAQSVQKSGGIAEGFLVQQMVTGGVEVILGFARDPQLGGYILLGAGGVTTELYQDTAIRMLPVDRRSAIEMIDSLKSAPLLKGFRGRPKADIGALAEAIVSFGRLAATMGDRLQEAEINPLFVLPQGQGVCAADGLVVLD